MKNVKNVKKKIKKTNDNDESDESDENDQSDDIEENPQYTTNCTHPCVYRALFGICTIAAEPENTNVY